MSGAVFSGSPRLSLAERCRFPQSELSAVFLAGTVALDDQGGRRCPACWKERRLITGGGGLGRAAALAFAREGARVAVADVAIESAREAVAQVNAAGGQAISLAGDVTRDADVRAMIDAVVGRTAGSTAPSTTPTLPGGMSVQLTRRPRSRRRRGSTG